MPAISKFKVCETTLEIKKRGTEKGKGEIPIKNRIAKERGENCKGGEVREREEGVE